MNKERRNTRNKLKQIESIKDFDSLLDNLKTSDENKDILRMIYCKEMSFIEIGEILGLSEQTIKYRHKKLLIKLKDIF